MFSGRDNGMLLYLIFLVVLGIVLLVNHEYSSMKGKSSLVDAYSDSMTIFVRDMAGVPLDKPLYYEKGLLVGKVEQDKLLKDKYYLKYKLSDQDTLVEKVSFEEYANANVGEEYHIILNFKKEDILFAEKSEERFAGFVDKVRKEGWTIVGILDE